MAKPQHTLRTISIRCGWCVQQL